MKKNRVLIVDDNNQLRNVLSVFLSQKGFSTETAENGVEGLNKFTSHPFDVVLTDIQHALHRTVCLYQMKSEKNNRKPLLL